MNSVSNSTPGPARLKQALIGGLIAGTVDIGAASIINGRNPAFVSQAIGSGLLGPQSFKDGASSALLGVVLQWAMSVIIALIYGYSLILLPSLRRHWISGGLIGGTVTFFVMNYVVLRLSAVGRFAHFTFSGFVANFAAILVYGLIIAYFAKESADN